MLSDISIKEGSDPCNALHYAAMILKEALQLSPGMKTKPLNLYDVNFEKVEDVVPNFVIQFLMFLLGKTCKIVIVYQSH